MRQTERQRHPQHTHRHTHTIVHLDPNKSTAMHKFGHLCEGFIKGKKEGQGRCSTCRSSVCQIAEEESSLWPRHSLIDNAVGAACLTAYWCLLSTVYFVHLLLPPLSNALRGNTTNALTFGRPHTFQLLYEICCTTVLIRVGSVRVGVSMDSLG